MNPEISVIIPLYNKERYIQRTIDSVLCQTFQNFECVIIDSSTDRSIELVKKYDDPRIVLVSCEKSTAAQARNNGTQIAQSDLFAFLDADDEWHPDHLETLIHIRKKFPDAGLYSTPYVKLKPDGSPMVMLFPGIPRPPWEGYLPNYLRTCARGDEPVHSSSCAVPRDIFKTMGGFPEDLVYGEDQFLWGKISLTYPVAYSWNGLTIYHTEALGRICNKPHIVKEQPFTSYLRRKMAHGTIPPAMQAECRAYIMRKRFSGFFSILCMMNISPCKLKAVDNERETSESDTTKCNFSGIDHFLGKIYYSFIHDAIRLLASKVYRSFDPGSYFLSDTQTKKNHS